MVDLLIPGVPHDVVAVIDGRARRLGLSRETYVRRLLAREAAVSGVEVAVDDLTWFAATFADLAADDVSHGGWEN